LRRRNKVTHWNWDSAKVVNNTIDVVAHGSRNGDNRCAICNGALDEVLDVLLLFSASVGILDNDVYLVLKYDDLVQVHDLHSCQVL
jgi:hypothetical protein